MTLEQVLKEVMRLVPPVGGGFREAIATLTKMMSYIQTAIAKLAAGIALTQIVLTQTPCRQTSQLWLYSLWWWFKGMFG